MDLKDLSRHLGVSMTTVSRALNGYPDVSEATRARVVEAAREFGYKPHPIARRLASGRAEAVGVVLPLPAGHFSDPFFIELLAGIGKVLSAANLDLLVTSAETGPNELEAYRHLVEGKKVDALIIGRTRRHDERLLYLLDSGIPFVAHGRTETDRAYAWLDMDNEMAFATAAERLIGLGHRRIGLINAPEEFNFAYLRRKGYERALSAAGIGLDPTLVIEGEMTEATGHRMTGRLLDLPEPPTAIICANDMIAIGALRALRKKGLEAGRDVSIIGYDDLPLASYTEPPLTTLNQPIRAAGERIAEMLLELLSGTPVEELRELWPPRLVVRQSDGPCQPPPVECR